MNPSTQIHRPDHIFIKLKFKQRRQLPTGCLLKYKKVIPMNSVKVKKLIMTNSFKVKYYLVTHCCMTHHYNQALCQKSFVEWGFIHSECEITPQCSCSIHHRRHCVSHQVRDLVRFVTWVMEILSTLELLDCPKSSNKGARISHQVTRLMWNAYYLMMNKAGRIEKTTSYWTLPTYLQIHLHF